MKPSKEFPLSPFAFPLSFFIKYRLSVCPVAYSSHQPPDLSAKNGWIWWISPLNGPVGNTVSHADCFHQLSKGITLICRKSGKTPLLVPFLRFRVQEAKKTIDHITSTTSFGHRLVTVIKRCLLHVLVSLSQPGVGLYCCFPAFLWFWPTPLLFRPR